MVYIVQYKRKIYLYKEGIVMQILIWVIVGAIVLIVLWFISAFNSLVKLRALYEEAFSGMDIFLKKRYDLIPNLVETVKGYASHESSTLEAVINARNRAASGTNRASVEDRLENEALLSGAVTRLLAVAEQYPQLKADSQFLNLSAQLANLEGDIAQSRKYYNGAAREYNTKIALFPTSIVASIGKFTKQPYFELEDASERSSPEVSF